VNILKIKRIIYFFISIVVAAIFIFSSITILPIVFKKYDDSIKEKIISESGVVYGESEGATKKIDTTASADDPLLRRYMSEGEAKTKPFIREAAPGEISLEKAIALVPTEKLMAAEIIPKFTRPIQQYRYNAILYDYSKTDYRNLVNTLWYIEVRPKDTSKPIKDGPIYIKYYLDSITGKLYEVEYAIPIGLRKRPAKRYSIMDNTYCNIMNTMFAKYCGIDVTMMTKVMEVKSGTTSSVYLDNSGLVRISASEGVTSDGDELWKLSLIDVVTSK